MMPVKVMAYQIAMTDLTADHWMSQNEGRVNVNSTRVQNARTVTKMQQTKMSPIGDSSPYITPVKENWSSNMNSTNSNPSTVSAVKRKSVVSSLLSYSAE